MNGEDPCEAWKCDATQWPIVVLSASDRLTARVSLGAHLDALFARRQRVALCLDLRQMTSVIDVAARRRLVDWVNMRSAETNGVVAAVAAAITTPLHRGLITAVLWQVKPQMPTHVFYAVEEASLWLQEQLEADVRRR